MSLSPSQILTRLQTVTPSADPLQFRNIVAEVLTSILQNTSGPNPVNSATAAQTPAATTRTYITGSKLALPASGLKVGAIFRWMFDMTKTAAGSAASTIDVAFGTAGTTADTARVSFTKPAGTAAADEAVVVVEVIIQSIDAATGVAIGTMTMTHNLAATGHATIACVAVNTTSSGFDTTAPTFVGLCITTGASDAITINQCSAYALGL